MEVLRAQGSSGVLTDSAPTHPIAMPVSYACATAAEPGFPSLPAHALPILVAHGAAVIARCL